MKVVFTKYYKQNTTKNITRFLFCVASLCSGVIASAIVCSAALSSTVYASAPNPAPHAHGSGYLTVIFYKSQLLIELITPANNILGFEHAPQTKAQWQAYSNVATTLKQPNQLISLTPQCQPTDTLVKLPFENLKGNNFDATHSHSHEHEHEHEHEQKDNQIDSKKKLLHAEHTNIVTRYSWSCTSTRLPIIDVKYFTVFPGFKTINTEWVINGNQGATPLTPQNTTISLD